MSVKTSLNKLYRIMNKNKISKNLKVSYQAMNGWHNKNRMPDTEFSGRTQHSIKIQVLTDNKVTVSDLLGHVPVAAQQYADKHKIEIS